MSTQQHDISETIFGEEPPEQKNRVRGHRQPRNRSRRWAVLGSAGVIVAGGLGFAWPQVSLVVDALQGNSATAMDFAGPGQGEVKIVVKPGHTGEQIATTLRDSGVVKTRTAYLEAAKANPQAAQKIQPGTYTLLKGMKGVDAFQMMIDPANRVAKTVTVREGLWATETYAVLAKATGQPLASYAAAAKNTGALGLPAQAGGKVEGWLMPSTYEFPDKATAKTQLTMMIKETVNTLTKLGVPKDQWQKTIVLASLVEAEAKLDVDRPKIARVFLNRVETQGGGTYGLLQSDAAVSYGAKRRALFPTKAELADASNPYNTRIHPGWPPGPISNPGAASIKGAAQPAAGNWFYFVAVNPITGETRYAETLDEHNRNVALLDAYCREKPKDCGL